jgi:uncharacterized protein (TIGR01777 family)
MTQRPETKRVAVTGARGFLGAALVADLMRDGWRVHPLVRRPTATPDEIRWDPVRGTIEAEKLEGCQAVVHLAGESLAGVWTAGRKRRIMQSRAEGTRLLARSLADLRRKPRVLVSASAVGYYGDAGDTVLTEGSPPGSDFLARVCRAWEEATLPATEAGIRVVNTRFGLILHGSGGVLGMTLLPFRLGLGAKLGDGIQWLSWVSLADVVRILRLVLDDDSVVGAVNATAPNPVRNADYTRAVARAVGWALRPVTGGMADAVLLASQRAIPAALTERGFRFEHPSLREALEAGLR